MINSPIYNISRRSCSKSCSFCTQNIQHNAGIVKYLEKDISKAKKIHNG